MPITKEPSRTIRLTAFYDAAATTKESDYGNFTSIVTEDFYFSSATRAVALARLRREIRNNPYLAGLVNKYPEAIGYSNLRSRTSDRQYNDLKNLWWSRFAKSVTITGDSLRTLEDIIKRELLIAGEIFLVLQQSGKVQVIPSEYCGSPLDTTSADGREINGIVYADNGRPIAYRFGRMNGLGLISYDQSEPINARFVIHIFHKDRVQMGRGLPWLLPSLRTAHDLYEITRSKTKQIKDANMISGWIEKAGAADFLKGLDAPAVDENTGAPVAEKPNDPADKIGTTTPVVIEWKPGTFIALEPGEKLNSLMSSYNATDYKELVMLMLHAVSSPVGLPVELWFSGLGDVNYSGYKGLGVQWNGRRQDVIQFLTDAFYSPFQFWRVSKAANEGDLPKNPDNDDDKVDWMFRRTPVLDEEKNSRANALRLESGETDLAEIWEELGFYPEEVFARRRELWIKLQIASGKLKEGDDNSAVEVPEIFLLRGLLPGETPAPMSTRSNIPATDGGTNPATEDAEDKMPGRKGKSPPPPPPDSKK